tara:strand:+ start:2260 stop:4284 length:2025 start_codon:yes stop_codon:yes gene_type:complete
MSNQLEIVWVFEKYVNGGAFTSAWHLYNAFKKYRPEFKQSVYVSPLNAAFKKKIKSWPFKHEVVTVSQLRKKLQVGDNKKVCFIHKLMNTRVERYLKAMKKACPIYVINHTYSKSAASMRYGPCEGIISVSEMMRKEQKRLNSCFNHFCIHNSIDSDLFEGIDVLKNEDHDGYFVTGRVNALNNIKYNDRWIKFIYNGIKGSSICGFDNPIWHDYIGSGSHIKKAKKIIEENSNNRNKVVMHGQINDVNKKISIVKSWDIFFYHINRHEGTSMSILEALSCGVPVVCSDHHGNKEIIKDGINGFVFKDLKHAVKIVNKLINNPTMLEDLKISTKEDFNNNLSSEQWVNKYVNVIKNSYKISDSGRIIGTEGPGGNNSAKQYTNFPLSKASNKDEKKNDKNKRPVARKNIKSGARSKRGVMMGDKFTILSTFSNYEKFVSDWFDSILQQSYRPLEVIAVDDCSKDDTHNALKSYAKLAKRHNIEYRVHRNKKKLYCGSSYHEAFRLSSGDYFGILDGDDQLVDNAVNVIMEQYQKRPNIDYIYTQFVFCDQKMQPTKRRGFCSSPLPDRDMLSSELSGRKRHCFSHWRTFKRFPAVEKIFYKGGKRSVDKFMGYRLEEWGNGMFFDTVLYKYRSPHKKSITRSGGQIKEWKKIRSQAKMRRKKYKLKSKKVISIK